MEIGEFGLELDQSQKLESVLMHAAFIPQTQLYFGTTKLDDIYNYIAILLTVIDKLNYHTKL